MLSYSDLKKGAKIVIENQPYEIIEADFLFKGRGQSVLQAKLKNLITGNIISKTFHPGQEFEEAEISKIKSRFLYSHRDKFFFREEENAKRRFDLTGDQIGEVKKFLKPNQMVEALFFEGRVINIILPIKIHLKVIEAPPGIKGDRAEPGTKQVTLETGAKINVPLFIEEGDIIELNTQTGQYLRRIE